MEPNPPHFDLRGDKARTVHGGHVETFGVHNTSRWDDALDEFPQAWHDVYFNAWYHAMHETTGEGTAECTVVRGNDVSLFVPGMRVRIPDSLPSVAGRRTYDLQSCNGYAGPLATPGSTREALASAWESWRTTSARQGIVAALFRLHPLLNNELMLPSDALVRIDRPVIYLDLSQGVEAVWRGAEGRHRNMVNKGRRLGTTVIWNDPVDWGAFTSLYAQAMERLNAPQRLRYGTRYFTALAASSVAELAAVHDDRGIIAAAIFLHGPKFWHYHLAARRSDAANYSTNVLLQDAVERAVRRGAQGLLLGGGVSSASNDPLLKFKRSLGGNTLAFKIALVVSDRPMFAQLLGAWEREYGRTPSWLLGYRQLEAEGKDAGTAGRRSSETED